MPFRKSFEKLLFWLQLGINVWPSGGSTDGVGIRRDAATAKPQFFITGDGWFTYNLLVNVGNVQ